MNPFIKPIHLYIDRFWRKTLDPQGACSLRSSILVKQCAPSCCTTLFNINPVTLAWVARSRYDGVCGVYPLHVHCLCSLLWYVYALACIFLSVVIWNFGSRPYRRLPASCEPLQRSKSFSVVDGWVSTYTSLARDQIPRNGSYYSRCTLQEYSGDRPTAVSAATS